MMKNAVITDDFEKKLVIPAYHVTKKEKKRLRRVGFAFVLQYFLKLVLYV